MTIINYFKTALYSIRNYKVRFFLTTIGIIIGICSVVVILSIGDGLNKKISDSIKEGQLNIISISYLDVDTNNTNGEFCPFTEEDMNEISQIEGVSSVNYGKENEGVECKYCDMNFFGNSSNSCISEYKNQKLKLEAGRSFSTEEANVIILSHNDCEKLFESSYQAIGKAVIINSEYYEVVGVIEKLSESLEDDSNGESYVPKKNFEKIDMNSDISSLSITVFEDENKDAIISKSMEILKENHKDTQEEYNAIDAAESMKSISGLINGVTRFIAVVSAISLIVAGVGVMNIMYVSISEKKREIGIRRAVGAYPRDILFQFLVETVIITFLGGFLGLLLGYFITKIIGMFMPFSPVITINTIIISLGISILTGIIFGMVPAKKAADLPPIQAIYK